MTDNDTEFDNKLFVKVIEMYEVKQVFTPPYHAQSNSTERFNITLKPIFAYVGNDHRNWDTRIHEFRHAVNTAVQSSTKISPAFLNFGRNSKPVKSLRREDEGDKPVKKIDTEYGKIGWEV